MLKNIMMAAAVLTFVGTVTPAVAQDYVPYANAYGARNGGPAYGYGGYADRYGLGYTNSARHDPRDTNGF